MFRFIIELSHLLLLYGLFYVTAFLILIGMLIYGNTPRIITQTLPTTTWIEPVKVQKFKEVCPRIDGCRIVGGVCEGCRMVVSE